MTGEAEVAFLRRVEAGMVVEHTYAALEAWRALEAFAELEATLPAEGPYPPEVAEAVLAAWARVEATGAAEAAFREFLPGTILL